MKLSYLNVKIVSILKLNTLNIVFNLNANTFNIKSSHIKIKETFNNFKRRISYHIIHADIL